MARYGKIETGFWHSRKIRQLSEEAKFLMLYLLSCPHGNAVGCFVLHNGYISADLGWSAEAVAERVQELISKDLIERDSETLLLRILGWWGHNSIENPNVAKHVAKEVSALPACNVKDHAIEAVFALTALHPTVVQILSERLVKPFRNDSGDVGQPSAKPLRNQEPILSAPNTPESGALAIASPPTVVIEKPKERGTRINTDWRPNEEHRQFARALQFTDTEIDYIYPGFVDYWTSKAGPNAVKRDWSGTWRNWIRKEAERTNRKGALPAQAALGSIDWDRYVADYRASNGSRWPHRQLGPEPGYAGCRVPLATLIRYGFAQRAAATQEIALSFASDSPAAPAKAEH